MNKNKMTAAIILFFLLSGQSVRAVMQKILVKNIERGQLLEIKKAIDIDIVSYNPEKGLVCLINESQVPLLSAKGLDIEVILPDASKYYSELKSAEMKLDMGPYYTYPEAVAEAYNLAALYPGIVSVPESIGASHQGRKIIAFSISKNPGSDNGNLGVLYTGMHHAREPVGCSICFGFAKYLCENYDTDSTIRYFVNNRQIWFIPIINPDGYVFNTDSSEDGMWRKNRRDNGDGTIGVDLNRNYPYMWGYDDIGSSGITESDDYRGPYAASEPEVQAVINFVQNKEYFKTAIDFHAYSNNFCNSWCYNCTYTPDTLVFHDLARAIRSYNGYIYFDPIPMGVNGCFIDWHYGEQVLKPKTYAFLPEVGGDFYQPDTAIIQQQIEENIWTCLLTGLAADMFLGATGTTVVMDHDSNGIIEPGETAGFADSVKNHSMEKNANQVTAVLSSDDAYIDINNAAFYLGDFSPRQTKLSDSENFEITVDEACPQGHRAEFLVNFISEYDNYSSFEYKKFTIGKLEEYVFNDDIENGTMNWTHEGGGDLWHISSNTSYSPSNSWYCGNEGTWDYLDNMDCRLVSEEITADSFVTLEFWHSYFLEREYDFACVEISTDGGTTWQRVGNLFTANSEGWIKETIDLYGYSGTIRIAYRMYTDISVHNYPGWYIDDISVAGYDIANTAPERPIPLQPVDESVTDSMPILYVGQVSDLQGDFIHYGYKIYSDSLLTQIYAETDSSPSDTSWQVPVELVSGTYWWRAYADDGKDRSLFSTKAKFYYTPTGIEQENNSTELPIKYAAGQSYPNPMQQYTTIRYQIPRAGPVCIKVYNIQGQLVKVLENSTKQAGYYSARWDGKDSNGQKVTAGVYVCQLALNDYRTSKKMVVLK